MRGTGAAVEVAVGLVDDQRDTVLLAEVKECLQRLGRVFNAGRIVGADQCNCAGARGDQLGGGGSRQGSASGPHPTARFSRPPCPATCGD